MAPEALAHVQRVRVTDFRFTERWRVVGGDGGVDAGGSETTTTRTLTTGTGDDTIRGLRLLAQRCTNLKELTVQGGGCLMTELPSADGGWSGHLVRRMPSPSELLTCFPVNVALLELRGLVKVEFDSGVGVCGGCAKYGRAEALFGGLKEVVERTLVLPKVEKAGEGGEEEGEHGGDEMVDVDVGVDLGSKGASSSRVRKREGQLTVRKRQRRV